MASGTIPHFTALLREPSMPVDHSSRPKIDILPSLKGYRPAWLGKDLSAGLAAAAVGLPSAMAYPAIVGLPPETELYAGIAPLVAYAVFGPSRRLIVGPDAGTMAVLAGAIGAVAAAAGPDVDHVQIAGLIADTVGLLCIIARVSRLGLLASFLSRPILTGFFAGISLSIIVGQISHVTGVKVDSDGLFSPFFELVQKADDVHLPSLVLAATLLALIFGLRAIRSPLPGPVVVVVLSVLLSTAFDFENRSIAVVGQIPRQLPSFSPHSLSSLPLGSLLVGAMSVFLVSFGSGIITAKTFGAMDGQKVIPNRELEGFSAVNIAAGLFGTFPVTASDSRTAINFSVGGPTLVYIIYKSMFPHVAVLGLIPGREGFYKTHRNPAAQMEPGLGLCLLQGNVLFVNTKFIDDRLTAIADSFPEGTTCIVWDAGTINQIDTAGVPRKTRAWQIVKRQERFHVQGQERENRQEKGRTPDSGSR